MHFKLRLHDKYVLYTFCFALKNKSNNVNLPQQQPLHKVEKIQN